MIDFILALECCGSKIDFKQTVSASGFRRFSSGGGFFVNYTLPEGIDLIPPSRIIDLRRTESPTFDGDKFVTFEWSAPGNDFIHGKAYQYLMHCVSSSGEELEFDHDILPEPKNYGAKQSVVIKVPTTNTVWFYSIYAIDEVIRHLTSIWLFVAFFSFSNDTALKFGIKVWWSV